MNEKATVPAVNERNYDEPVQDAYAEFMKTGWAESHLNGMAAAPAVP